jgi:hypothetical protein
VRVWTIVLPLCILSVFGSARQDEPVSAVAHRWIAAVTAHHPGEVDQALFDAAAEPPSTFRKDLEKLLRQGSRAHSMDWRNDLRRRGALLHTDIALLIPDKAAAFAWPDAPPQSRPVAANDPSVRLAPEAIVYSVDGQFLASDVESGHWQFASWLLAGMEPDPSSDGFVPSWYWAVAATFLSAYRFGNCSYHLARGRRVLPRDPVLLLYAGAMHEALASPRAQNVQGPHTNGLLIGPRGARFPSERER